MILHFIYLCTYKYRYIMKSDLVHSELTVSWFNNLKNIWLTCCLVKQGLSCWINSTVEEKSCSILAILRSSNFFFLCYTSSHSFFPLLQIFSSHICKNLLHFLSFFFYLYLVCSLDPTPIQRMKLIPCHMLPMTMLLIWLSRWSFLVTAPHYLQSLWHT